jgi:DNA-binding MurR/RpiR family transcriptional regulator
MTNTPKELPPHDLLDWIASVESQFSPAEQLIADYVLTLPERVLQLSMRSLAERAGVSDGSVLRFCRLAGCKGFPAFKIAVAQSLAAHRRPPSAPWPATRQRFSRLFPKRPTAALPILPPA